MRLHRGGEAARLNDAMSADAFTIGDDVFLGARASSAWPVAEGVLAHEIAHVLSEPNGTSAVRRRLRRRPRSSARRMMRRPARPPQRTQAFEDIEPLPPGVICVIGDTQSGRSAGDDALTNLAASLTVADLEAELARKPRRNVAMGIAFIRDMIKLKTGKEAAAAAAAGA